MRHRVGSDEAEDCIARNAEGAGQTLTLRAPLRTASSSTSAYSVAILTIASFSFG